MRSQKQKLSRQLRDHEEEVAESQQRAENLRQEIRKADKARREVGYSDRHEYGHPLARQQVEHPSMKNESLKIIANNFICELHVTIRVDCDR